MLDGQLSVKVGVIDIPVRLDPSAHDKHGYYVEEHGPEIFLGPSTVDNESWSAQTVFHEALHAVFRQSGVGGLVDHEVEEHIVTVLDSAVIQILKDNPWLKETLLDERKRKARKSASNRNPKIKGRRGKSEPKDAQSKSVRKRRST